MTTKTSRSLNGRKHKLTESQIARLEARAADLARVQTAIAEGRAYLNTFVGRKLVVGYNDETGWATTNTTQAASYLSQQSFMVCLEAIQIAN